jgi:hydrogenase maturation protease
MKTHTLVIGYGNPLRGDDGIGPRVAEIVESWKIPGVKVLTRRQLVPELIDEIKGVQRVLFVDAAMDPHSDGYTADRAEPHKSRRPLGHHETPGNLLALARDLEQAAPDAWLVTISALALEHGEAISEIAEDNIKRALVWIRAWLAE